MAGNGRASKPLAITYHPPSPPTNLIRNHPIRSSKRQALTNISDLLAQGVPLDDFFPVICEEATILMNCERASLFLVRDCEKGGGQQLWSKIAMGIPPIHVPLKENSIAGATGDECA